MSTKEAMAMDDNNKETREAAATEAATTTATKNMNHTQNVPTSALNTTLKVLH